MQMTGAAHDSDARTMNYLYYFAVVMLVRAKEHDADHVSVTHVYAVPCHGINTKYVRNHLHRQPMMGHVDGAGRPHVFNLISPSVTEVECSQSTMVLVWCQWSN